MNEEYEVTTNVPGYFAFGGNGGGEMFVFKIVDGSAERVFMIPYIPMDEEDAVEMAADFARFREAMGKVLSVPNSG